MALSITSRNFLSPFTGLMYDLQPWFQGAMAGKTHMVRNFLITLRPGENNGKASLKLQVWLQCSSLQLANKKR